MGKGRDKRRRNTRHKHEVGAVAAKPEPLTGESSGPVDPYAPVLASLKPKPSLRSGAIALSEPEVWEFVVWKR